ncbi:MAG: transcriptional regulator, family [Frankiales bacterium]|nr:transcriptional regulator, family [Frankiales bacterium]
MLLVDEQREQLRDFLTSRRARLTPQQVGLPRYGGSARRVPGLRRSELATLAGMSVERPTELERGNATGASDGVLTALARCSSTGPRPPTCSTWPVAPAMPPAPPAGPPAGGCGRGSSSSWTR